MRKLALLCCSPPFDADEMPLTMPSFGIHRVHAAARSGVYPHPVDIRFFDLGKIGHAECLQALLDFEPDLIGFSVYVWSLAPLMQLAADVRARHPKALLLWGGPSARHRSCASQHQCCFAQKDQALQLSSPHQAAAQP